MLNEGFLPVVITSEVPDSFIDPNMENHIKDLNLIIYRYSYSNHYWAQLIGKLRTIAGIPVDQVTFGGIFNNMYKTAQTALNKYHFDLIYSISSKGDAHRVGNIIHKKYNIPWIAEFQDPWLDNQTLNEWMKEHSFKFYQWFWQKKVSYDLYNVLKNTCMVITESDGHYAKLIKRSKTWNIDSNKIIRAYLGSDPFIIEKLGQPKLYQEFCKTTYLKIGFIGEIYYGYEETARKFIHCLQILEKQGIRFSFISVGCSTLPRLASEIGLTNIISLYSVPYKEAIGIMSILDWGVTIPSSDININSKFFDYLQQNCKVISWGHPNGDMASLIKEHNCGIVIDDADEEKAVNQLEVCLTTVKSEQKYNTDWFTRKRCFEPVIKRINDILKVKNIKTSLNGYEKLK